MLLPIPDQGSAVDLVADTVLHHVPPVELQTRVCRVHPSGRELRRRDEAVPKSNRRREQVRRGRRQRERGSGAEVSTRIFSELTGDVAVEFEEFTNVPDSTDTGSFTHGNIVPGKAPVQHLPGTGFGFGDLDIGGIARQPTVHDDDP